MYKYKEEVDLDTYIFFPSFILRNAWLKSFGLLVLHRVYILH